MSKLTKVSERRDRTEYAGKLHDFQQLGNTFKELRYAELEKDPFNAQQNFLYKRALFGLKMYTEEELSVMHADKKKRIIKVYTRAQRVLNLYKQHLVNEKTNRVMTLLFPNSPITKEFEQHSYVDPKFVNTVSFKDLGVSKKQIVDRLISEKILPVNFYNLVPDEH